MLLEVKIVKDKIYSPIRKKDLVLKPEEKVRQEFVAQLVNHYGFSLEQMSEEVQVNNSQRGQGKAQADIAVWKSVEDKQKGLSPIIVVECKAGHITIREEDYYQGYNYAAWAGADFFVTTNMKDTKFFKVVKGVMPKKLEEIIEIPKAEDVNNEKKIHELLTKTKAFTRDEFSRLLFKCHTIIRNNDKLSPEAAFDEISKILFMKIRYERQKSREKAIFSSEQFEKLKKADEDIRGKSATPFYQYLFEQTKEAFRNDQLFDVNESIKIRETSFLNIVKELEKYNLSDTSDDIKGIAFEEFLGKTFRGELGQFFTPRTIVDYMVEILDPIEGEFICDPCCGSGGFLIKAFEYVREKIEADIEAQKEKIKETYYTEDFDKKSEKEQQSIIRQIDKLFENLNYELDLMNDQSRLRSLSYDCIFGIDANPRMARTAKMNMIMHGDGHGGVHHHDGLLNINGIFDGRFDVILTNPPFGSRVEKSLKVTLADIPDKNKLAYYKSRYPNYEALVVNPLRESAAKQKSILSLYEVGKMSGLTEVLFIERCLNLLKPGGRLGIVLPEGVLNNAALSKVREYFEGKAKILNITSIPQDVFVASGATVKASLLFLKKFSYAEEEQCQAIIAEATLETQLKYAPEIEKIEAELAEKENILRGGNKEEKEEMPLLKKDKKALAAFKKENKEALDAARKEDREALTVAQKECKEALRQIEQQQIEEIRSIFRDRFNYSIPVVEIEKAGISSTGTKIENELIDVAIEFKTFRIERDLWQGRKKSYTYPIIDNEITRSNGVNEPEVFYGQQH